MRLTLFVLLTGLLLHGCAPYTARAPVGDRSKGVTRHPDFHTVRHGETLYSVAFLYGYQVSQVAAWNDLHPPYTIYKSQRLRLRPPPRPAVAKRPVPASKPKPQPAPANPPRSIRPSVPKTVPVRASRPKTSAPVAAGTGATAASAATRPARVMPPSSELTWSWPSDGPLLKTFNANHAGRKGINIGGSSGQPVRAAAAGKVVYSGSGLGGYGRLIIIKHNKEFLSAYAHNRTLIASEGQWVEKGRKIALMGNSGTNRVQLHFEIRRQGKPVDPMKYLPAR